METDPTYVVEKSMFMQNSFPYLEVRRPFILGTRQRIWKATIAHRFAELLHTKTGKLTRVYTQNIDGLYQQCTGIPVEKVVNVHGTLGAAACEACGNPADFDEFCNSVRENIKDIYQEDINAPRESTPVTCSSCGRAAVKPKTVLFGSSLPSEFFERGAEDMPKVDMLIVAGTSLVVSPANSLVYSVPDEAIRVVINKEPVGSELGIEYGPSAKRDYFAKGACDDIFLELMDHLGWLDDLATLIDELPSGSVDILQSKLKSRSN